MTSALRVGTPGQIAALVPHLIGFTPHESLVALSLRGPRRRVGLTLRADLTSGPALVDQVVAAMRRDGAAAVALVVHTDQPSGAAHPWSALVAAVEADLAGHGVEVTEALLVRAGSWWSYRCAGSCCPATGSPVESDSDVVRTTAAEQAYRGRAVLSSREALVDGLRAQPPLGPALARTLQDQAGDALADRCARDPDEAVREELARWRAALDAWERHPAPVVPADTAALAVGLHLVAVRDRVASWGLTRSDALLGLLSQLVGGVVAPDDAPLCTVLAWVSYAEGNGAVALVAVQRALATDPDHELARLLLAALDGALPPGQVRAVLRGAARGSGVGGAAGGAAPGRAPRGGRRAGRG